MRKYIYLVTVLFLTFLFAFQSLQAQNEAPPEWATCAACHSIGKGKLIGPDLKGVTERRDREWIYSFIRNSQAMIQAGDEIAVQLFEEHNKIPMANYDYTDEQIEGLLTYIENYDETADATAGEVAAAPVEEAVDAHDGAHVAQTPKKYGPGNTQPTFIIFLILILVSIIDLLITKVVRAKFIHIIVVLVSVFVLGEITYIEAKALGRQEGYSPDQPVWFSHKVHAGQNQIDCLYCHSSATESKSAGIPGVNVCMNCHNVVKKGTKTGEEEIAKVVNAWNKQESIDWVRVHNLPDHVFFSHAQHVNAGKLDCTECHGKVEEMDRITQVQNLGMGWCINCHRTTEVQFEDNGFYKEYVKFHEEMHEGKRSRVYVNEIGGNNCNSCHY